MKRAVPRPLISFINQLSLLYDYRKLIRKKFVHNTMTDAVNRLYAAWRPAVSVFQVRSGELQRFAQSGASSKQISDGSYELRLFIPLHLRFLDIQYRKPKGKRAQGQSNLLLINLSGLSFINTYSQNYAMGLPTRFATLYIINCPMQ